MSDLADAAGRADDEQIAPPATQRRLIPGAEGKACLWPTRSSSPIRRGAHDIALERDRVRRRRVYRFAVVVLAAEAYVIVSALLDRPIVPPMPTVDPLILVPVLFFAALLLLLVGTQMGSARSPHVVYRPEQVDVRLDDVIGIDPVKEDVRRSIDLFQTHKQFAEQMGGTPRRGLLFEGLPGTGKTMTAKAMAAEAGVPFLFVSATSFQSMYYGATAKKIRAYFKALRKAARTEGGAIGFIEEIDAIAIRRGGMASAAVASEPVRRVPGPRRVTNAVVSEGTGGVVNELLVQMQSFDQPTPSRQAGQLVHRAGQPAAAGDAPAAAAQARQGADPADRRDQPGRLPRPGPAAARAASTGG